MLDNLFIGVEHLLLGLLREEDSIAWRILTGLGVELESVRGAAHKMKWG
jgi:ATP-dependent Clp protease ATP-binding subunit ClpA